MYHGNYDIANEPLTDYRGEHDTHLGILKKSSIEPPVWSPWNFHNISRYLDLA